jgi:hypothetical protein
MCTLTFVPEHQNGFVLTSNRDEAPGRETFLPEIYEENGVRLLFPKDAQAGGTWIGVSSRNRLICLLNGGFTPHEREERYRMSRGIIVTHLLTSENIENTISDYDFHGIEPFTLVIADWNIDLTLFELVWDGTATHFSEKPLAPHIWSSSLLYSETVKRKREVWFSEFLLKHANPSETELLHFHKTAGDGNRETDVVMDRGFVKTKSITQVCKDSKITMRYEDLQSGAVTISEL